MKSRKLISFLGAAAMAGSAFSGLTMTAFAADTVLYSNSFDGYAKDTMVAFARKSADLTSDAGWKAQIEAENEPFYSLYVNDVKSSYEMDNEEGNSLTVQCGTGNIDDTSIVYIREKGTDDNYLSMPRARFSNKNGDMKLTGFDSYTANAGEDLLVSFKLMMTSGTKNDGTSYVPAISIGDIGTLTIDNTNISDNTWYDVRVVIPASGDAAVYIGETQVASKSGGSINSGFVMENNTEDTKSSVYPTVNFDEMVIMSVAAGTATTVDVPEADDVVDNSGDEPEATPAATIDATTTIDFEENGLSIVASEEDRVVTSVVDGAVGDNSTKVMQIVGSSDNSTRFGHATLDLSEYTKGKSHVIVEYDAYISSTGRMTYVLSNGAPATYSDSGIFRQGIPGSSAENVVADTWVHTVVDVDLIAGTGRFTVTAADENVISGNITTDIEELTTLSFVTWSPNTSYIDNIVIQTGGSMTITTPPPAATITPEPASEVEGSGLDLVPATAAEKIETGYTTTETKDVLNHSNACVAATTGNTDITAYSTSARGYSIYAIYDVYVGVDSSFGITPYGDSGKAQAATMQLVSDNTGVVTVSSIGKDGVVTAAPETLAHGTWYRVLVEVPQSGTSEAPVTGDLTYTVYRIDASDPTKVSEIASQQTGLTSRGLATKGLTSFGYAVTGEAYIDNLAVFRAAGGLDITPEAETTPEPASTQPGSGLTLVPEEGAAIDSLAAGSEEVLNHANATAVTTDGTTVNAYSDNVRGYSVYAAFDAYVNKGTTLTIVPVGNNDAQASTINLTASDLGKVTLSAVTGQGANDVVTADDTLAAGTWYRVLVEAPQNAVSEGETASTSTGTITVTVYRINVDDPSEVTEVAAQLTGLPARGLDGKALTGFTVSATAAETPSAYVDNFATFRADNALTLIPETWYVYTATYDGNGILTDITAEEVEDPSTVVPTDAENTRTFVWNNFMQPYVAETVEPAE